MQEKLRVAYYLHRFPRLTETFILREMLFLRDMGLDIQVFALMPPAPISTMHQQVQEMLPYVHYSPFFFSVKLHLAQLYFLLRSPRKYFRAFWRAIWQTWREPTTLVRMLVIFPKSVYFARQLKEMKVDHIHAHFVWINGIAAQIAADLTGITYSLHAHAWDIFFRNPECIRRQLELSTQIVTISQYNQKFLAALCHQRNPEDIHVVYCGLDPAEFTPAYQPDKEGTIRIISVGSLIEKKGHEYLIDACMLLVAKGYRLKCFIIGGGPLQPDLQIRINDRDLEDTVKLLGIRNQSQILDQYRQSDIFVLACVVAHYGDKDGIPVALMEAMAMQVPVITTPVTGIPELVQDGNNGLLVPERDSETLALAIERLIKDPQLRMQLGQQGRQTILAKFDIHHTASQMAGIFQEIHHSCV